jgi:hypothetical protein
MNDIKIKRRRYLKMRPSIKERMERQLVKTRMYNGMFDTAVAAAEFSTSATATEVTDNQYSVTVDNLTTYINCSDSDYGTINVGIDYQTAGGMSNRVADLTINVDGTYEENYHSIPKAIRTSVFNIINEAIDDVLEFIENFDPNEVSATPESDEE